MENIRMLEQGFEFAPIGVSFVDPDKKFMMASPFMTKLLGYSAEEFLEKYCYEITHEDDQGEFIEALDQILQGEQAYFQQKKRCIHKDGHEVWIDAFASGLKDTDGSISRIMILLVDIGEMVSTQQELKKKIEELGTMNQKLVGRELKMVELKKELEEAKAAK